MGDSETIYSRLLVVRCQLGERDALEELVARWERPLLFYVRRFVRDEHDARQVMQDVWLKVFAGLGALRDPERLAPWLYRLARNTFMDHLRDRYTRDQLLEAARSDAAACTGGPDAQAPAAADETAWLVAAEEVHYGLSRVSVVDREVLTLYFLEDLSVDEIAAVIGVPPGTVKSRLFNARKALRQVLATQKGAQR